MLPDRPEWRYCWRAYATTRNQRPAWNATLAWEATCAAFPGWRMAHVGLLHQVAAMLDAERHRREALVPAARTRRDLARLRRLSPAAADLARAMRDMEADAILLHGRAKSLASSEWKHGRAAGAAARMAEENVAAARALWRQEKRRLGAQAVKAARSAGFDARIRKGRLVVRVPAPSRPAPKAAT